MDPSIYYTDKGKVVQYNMASVGSEQSRWAVRQLRPGSHPSRHKHGLRQWT